jgi:hypothetical protein
MSIDKLEVYNLAMILGEKVWLEVERWSHFQKDVIGKQLVRSTNSIAANIAEGYGRFFYKENKQFCYYSRGVNPGNKSMVGKSKKQKSRVRRLLRTAHARLINHPPKTKCL